MKDKKKIKCMFCDKDAKFKLIGFPTLYSCEEHKDKMAATRSELNTTPVQIKDKP